MIVIALKIITALSLIGTVAVVVYTVRENRKIRRRTL